MQRFGQPAVIGAVAQVGNLKGVGFADEVSVGVGGFVGVEDVYEPGAPEAGPLEAEAVCEFEGEVEEEGVEEEEDYEDPFEENVDEDQRESVGPVVEHGRELVGRHGFGIVCATLFCSVFGW